MLWLAFLPCIVYQTCHWATPIVGAVISLSLLGTILSLRSCSDKLAHFPVKRTSELPMLWSAMLVWVNDKLDLSSACACCMHSIIEQGKGFKQPRLIVQLVTRSVSAWRNPLASCRSVCLSNYRTCLVQAKSSAVKNPPVSWAKLITRRKINLFP